MQHKLSIIIPCYNCAFTLKEAVASVYTQNLQIPFEVVMVNDASTDNTWEVMQSLAKEHEEIKLFQHPENLGGGAARNTGIKNSEGDLIFCLDADNFFPPNVLQKMVNFLLEKKMDGVAIHERRFFLGTNSRKYIRQFYKNPEYTVELEDLFNGSGVLLDNFLYTREAFVLAGGYPENHGFDTQCYEVRFLSKGLKVGFCPESVFYHRQKYSQKSYFDRVYEAGEYSKNMYLIYEEIFFLFSPRIRKLILSYDVFKNNKLGENNLGDCLVTEYKKNPKGFFLDGYEKFLHAHGFNDYIAKISKADSAEELACRQIFYYLNGQYAESLEEIKKIIQTGFISKLVMYNLYRTSLGLSKKYPARLLESTALAKLGEFSLKKRRMHAVPGVIAKLANKLPWLKGRLKSFFGINY